MPTAAFHSLLAHIADTCVASANKLATISKLDKSVVETARTFLTRDVASQVLRHAFADKSGFATASEDLKNALTTLTNFDNVTATGSAQFAEVSKLMIIECHDECLSLIHI